MDRALPLAGDSRAGGALTRPILAGLTLAAFALRLAGMGQSMFGDELYTYDIVRQSSLSDVVDAVHDTSITPPLHYVIAWAAVKVGDPTFWVRVPSLVAGTAAVPVVYLLGRRTVGRSAGLAAAAILAFSPFALFYSTEARAYATLVLLIALSTLFLLAALESRDRRLWLAFAVCSCAALYAHYTAVFPLAAQLAWALWARRARAREILAAHALVGIGYLPWLPSYLDQRHNSGIEAIEVFAPFTARVVGESLGKLVPGDPFVALDEVPGRVGLALLLVGLAFALAGAIPRLRGRPSPAFVLVLALALATSLGALVYSAVGSSIFVARNLLASLPAICLLGGALFAAAPLRLRLVALPLVLAGLVVGAAGSLDSDNRRPPWDEVAEYIDEHAGPTDPVIEINTFGTRSPLGQRPVLSNLKIYLDRPHRFYSTPASDDAVLGKVFGADTIYVVKNQLPGLEGAPPPPLIDPRFHFLGMRVYRGFAPIGVYVYSTTRST